MEDLATRLISGGQKTDFGFASSKATNAVTEGAVGMIIKR